MTDAQIRQAADRLRYIEHHEAEIRDLERRIAGHRAEIVKERAAIEKLKRGEAP